MRKLTDSRSILLLTAMLVVATSPAMAAQADSEQTGRVDSQDVSTTTAPLLGKWIVRSVEHDADPTAAQIGRKPGDIIEFAERDDGNLFLT